MVQFLNQYLESLIITHFSGYCSGYSSGRGYHAHKTTMDKTDEQVVTGADHSK